MTMLPPRNRQASAVCSLSPPLDISGVSTRKTRYSQAALKNSQPAIAADTRSARWIESNMDGTLRDLDTVAESMFLGLSLLAAGLRSGAVVADDRGATILLTAKINSTSPPKPHLAVILRSAVREEGSLFDGNLCPGHDGEEILRFALDDGQRRVAGRRDFGDEADTEKRRTVTKQSGAVPAQAPNSAP
jgi:hypothetical protein